MGQYRIVGHRRVAGKAPGDLLDESDIPTGALPHLIAAGHLAAAKTTRKTTQEEAPEED